MSAMLFVALFLGASPARGFLAESLSSSATAADASGKIWLAGNDLCDAIHQALRHWARPADSDVDRAAREFLQLSGDLQRDTQIAGRTRLELQTKLRYRLAELSLRIRSRVGKAKAETAGAEIASIKVPDAKGGNLAQVGAGPAVAGRGAMGPGAQGPAGQQGAGAADAAEDNGQMLVDLIQKTIAPDSWDINGGPGTIYYWRPGRALVISQTDDVHDLVGGLLGQMQKLGH
jgi:hypothetical protein